jgi:hypothetical protein
MADEKIIPASGYQIGGRHYSDMKMQVTEFTWLNKLDGLQHSVIKYICRFRKKGGYEDLLKAKHYIDLLIEWEYPEAIRDADKRID